MKVASTTPFKILLLIPSFEYTALFRSVGLNEFPRGNVWNSGFFHALVAAGFAVAPSERHKHRGVLSYD